MQAIELSNGDVTIVEDEDFEWLSKYKWYSVGGLAARRDGRTTIYMHKSIRERHGKSTRFRYPHRNGDGLDNRHFNLWPEIEPRKAILENLVQPPPPKRLNRDVIPATPSRHLAIKAMQLARKWRKDAKALKQKAVRAEQQAVRYARLAEEAAEKAEQKRLAAEKAALQAGKSGKKRQQAEKAALQAGLAKVRAEEAANRARWKRKQADEVWLDADWREKEAKRVKKEAKAAAAKVRECEDDF